MLDFRTRYELFLKEEHSSTFIYLLLFVTENGLSLSLSNTRLGGLFSVSPFFASLFCAFLHIRERWRKERKERRKEVASSEGGKRE